MYHQIDSRSCWTLSKFKDVLMVEHMRNVSSHCYVEKFWVWMSKCTIVTQGVCRRTKSHSVSPIFKFRAGTFNNPLLISAVPATPWIYSSGPVHTHGVFHGVSKMVYEFLFLACTEATWTTSATIFQPHHPAAHHHHHQHYQFSPPSLRRDARPLSLSIIVAAGALNACITTATFIINSRRHHRLDGMHHHHHLYYRFSSPTVCWRREPLGTLLQIVLSRQQLWILTFYFMFSSCGLS